MGSAFPPPGRWRRSQPASRSIARPLLPGAVLTRVAASHIRVGTFQYFAARGDTEGVRTLADYVIARHYPEIAEAERPISPSSSGVARRQAPLDRPLDAGGLHPRRDEYRQHGDLGRDHRLRPLRLHGYL